MELQNYDSFIFYKGWAETAKGFAEDFGEDFAKEMIWALVCYVCFGEIVTEQKRNQLLNGLKEIACA